MKSLPSIRRAGGTTSVIIRSILAVIFLLVGGQFLYVWMKNRTMVSMTYQEFIEKKPATQWIELRGVRLDILKSAGIKRWGNDKPEELYIPVLPDGKNATETKVVLRTEDPQYLAALNEYNSQKDDVARMGFLLANTARLKPERDIRGLIEFAFEADEGHRKEMEGLAMKLTKDAVVIADGKKPSAEAGFLSLAIGLGFGISLLFKSRSKPAPPIHDSTAPYRPHNPNPPLPPPPPL